ncbi:MAG: glycosyltransferase [Chlorobi bacterium]|nr:glycosyltransferase [Chlorobiota bacterium]
MGEWFIAVVALSFFVLATINAIAFLRTRSPVGVLDTYISVLIPARNEEGVLGRCIESVLACGDVVAEVLIYDDQSTDTTHYVAQTWSQRDQRVRVLETVPLPNGWYGKPHACYRLASAAQSQWLLFLDADAQLNPGSVERLIATARACNATLLSAWPKIEMVSPVERVLMPMLDFYVMTLLPSPLQQLSNHPRYALAHGSCMLCDRQTYFRLGGHSAVRTELFEDTALARHWRQSGEKSLCCDGQEIVHVRMYQTFGEIWRGFQKNFYPGFRRRWLFPVVLALHGAVFTVPFMAVLFTPTLPLLIAACAVGASRLVLALRFGHKLWSILWHPIAEVVLLALAVVSWWRSSRGVEWKDRRYRVIRPKQVME